MRLSGVISFKFLTHAVRLPVILVVINQYNMVQSIIYNIGQGLVYKSIDLNSGLGYGALIGFTRRF